MAEVEIHTEHEHADDPFGRRVGVMVGIIGIILAVVTISSHRAHTATVIAKTEANDQWAFYQAKKIREHLLDVAAGMAKPLVASATTCASSRKGYVRDRDRYKQEAEAIERRCARQGSAERASRSDGRCGSMWARGFSSSASCSPRSISYPSGASSRSSVASPRSPAPPSAWRVSCWR